MGRRLLTVPLVLAALPVLLALAPVWLPLTVLADLVSRLFRFPTVRLMLALVVYVAHEWACMAALATLGLVHLVRRPAADPEVALRPYRRIEGRWARSLVWWLGVLLGVRFDLPDGPPLPTGRIVLLSRHASMADAVMPLWLITGRLDRWAHYVMKRELQFLPTLDLYGERLRNYFISREGDGEAEAAAIGALARSSLPGSALVIFPEGTYATPGRRLRVRRSLARRGDPALVELADGLRHLLPPKPAGTLALLEGAPDADVVILGHTGLEGVAELAGLRRGLPLHRPVTVRWWCHPRAELPEAAGEEAVIAWLNDRWRSLDRWIDRASAEAASGGRPAWVEAGTGAGTTAETERTGDPT